MEVIINTGITWNFSDSKEPLAELVARILDENSGSDWSSDGESVIQYEWDEKIGYNDSIEWGIDQVFTTEDRVVTKVLMSC